MDKANNHLFPESSIDWAGLESIGIYREDLEYSGQLERLLEGEPTGAVPLNLMWHGVSLELDATLQLTVVDETVVVEITGVSGRPIA